MNGERVSFIGRVTPPVTWHDVRQVFFHLAGEHGSQPVLLDGVLADSRDIETGRAMRVYGRIDDYGILRGTELVLNPRIIEKDEQELINI